MEFTGPQYSMPLSKSNIDTRGVMKRGVSESVMSPILLSRTDKSWPGHVFCGVSRNIRALILKDIYQLAKTMSTFDSEVKRHEN